MKNWCRPVPLAVKTGPGLVRPLPWTVKLCLGLGRTLPWPVKLRLRARLPSLTSSPVDHGGFCAICGPKLPRLRSALIIDVQLVRLQPDRLDIHNLLLRLTCDGSD